MHDIDPRDFKSCTHLDNAPELPEDIIEKYSYKKLFNYGLGIELDRKYFEIAEQRIKKDLN